MIRDTGNDLRQALDPVVFAREQLSFHPDPWQVVAMRSGSKRLLLNCSRQSGKSTTTAAIALHCALFRPGALVLLISPSLRQSRELFAKVAAFLRSVEPRPVLIEDNRLSFTLHQGSRVVSLPASPETIRGYSGAAMIIEDEAAFVDDALYRAIRPMLAVSNGRLILMSTPYGKRGHFHDEWVNGGTDWERIQVTATECPRIDLPFLESERRSMGQWWYRQEYMCEFVETAESVFTLDSVMGALSDRVEPFNFEGNLRP